MTEFQVFQGVDLAVWLMEALLNQALHRAGLSWPLSSPSPSPSPRCLVQILSVHPTPWKPRFTSCDQLWEHVPKAYSMVTLCICHCGNAALNLLLWKVQPLHRVSGIMQYFILVKLLYLPHANESLVKIDLFMFFWVFFSFCIYLLQMPSKR